jgi:hypothetical protein
LETLAVESANQASEVNGSAAADRGPRSVLTIFITTTASAFAESAYAWRATIRRCRGSSEMPEPSHVIAVDLVGDHTGRWTFEDGVEGEVDLSAWEWRDSLRD